jgi:hypothetical protein
MTCHPRAGAPTLHTRQPANPLRPRTSGWRVPDHRRDHTRTTCASARPAGCAHHTYAPPLLAISDNELATAYFLAVAGSRHVADLRELSWAVAPWPWGLFISPAAPWERELAPTSRRPVLMQPGKRITVVLEAAPMNDYSVDRHSYSALGRPSAACGALWPDYIFARGRDYEATPHCEGMHHRPQFFVVARGSDASLLAVVAPFWSALGVRRRAKHESGRAILPVGYHVLACG